MFSSDYHLSAFYQEGEVRPEEVGDENGGDDDGEADVGAHGQEVVVLRPDPEDLAVTAEAAQQQAHQHQDLTSKGKGK